MNAPAPTLSGETLALDETRLIVPGIRCAGCVAGIERAAGAVPGVAHARVNVTARRVTIRHLPEVEGETLIAALAGAGFEAQRADAEAAPGSAAAAEKREFDRLIKALAVAGFGSMNVMLLSVAVWSGAQGATRDLFHWLSALIALPVVAYSGRPFFASAWKALRQGRTNMDVPIAIGVALVTALSLYETSQSGRHAYFDGATMLLFFLLAGRVLDAMMRARARAGVEALLSRAGPGATLVEANGATRWVAARSLEVGDTMRVAAGEAFAADGVVRDGASLVDLSLLTGESVPEAVGVGERVLAGSINLDRPLTVEVTAVGEELTIAAIARAMEDAQQGRSRYVRIADRAARLYAPAVHTLAALAFLGWLVAGAGIHTAITVAAAVLIITCPCALGLAVPAAQVVASGALMKRGVLVKDGSALERLAEVDHALLDKTGTLTLGEPRPTGLDALDAQQQGIALALARSSRHPLSRGLAQALAARGVRAADVTDIAELPGEGVSGTWNGQRVALSRAEGSATLACELVLADKRMRLPFADPLRPDAREAIAALRGLGIESALLSGDQPEPVASAANSVGVPVAAAAATPQQKLDLITARAAAGQRLLMVGDGINDGPALAAAHASLAPGSASDVSRAAADAVFTSDALMPVADAVRIARATMRVVRQNFVLAIGYNILAIPLALMGLVTPLIAALAMSGSSIIVVGNALRLARLGSRA